MNKRKGKQPQKQIMLLCFWYIKDTHKEKLLFSIQYKNGCLTASDAFNMFTQSIKLYYSFSYNMPFTLTFNQIITDIT